MNTFIMNSYASDAMREGRPTAAAVVEAAREAVVRLLDTLAEWQGRVMERRRLMELDARLLKDTGLTRAEAVAEYAKPFWRP